MFVFISYPREFDAVAAKLDAELKSRNINRFLDREGINLGDVWKLKIESNIKKSSVFIILYLPAAATQDRFFLTETEHIKKECEKNLKKIITVIFSPTVPRDLPPFFTNHQILEARAEGFRANERDGYWIDQIVQEVERLKEIERLDHQFKAKIKRRQIIARTALTTAGVIIAGLLYSKPPVPSSFGDRVLDGESMCNSLVGAYELHQGYVFTEGIDTRSIAKNASWKASNCEYRDRNATYILKGEEVTDFDIEVIINNKYERVATATYIYTSEVSISKDGKLLGRNFETIRIPQRLKKVYKDRNGYNLQKYETFIDEKIKEVLEIRGEKHKEMRTKYCTPALGETGGRVAIAFVCQGYTRAMVKIS